MRRRSTRQEWVELLALREESEKSLKAFCEEFGVAVHQFYYWRKRLREEPKTQGRRGEFVEVELAEVEDSDGGDSGLALDLKHLNLRVERDFDEATLRRVLRVAASLQC